MQSRSQSLWDKQPTTSIQSHYHSRNRQKDSTSMIVGGSWKESSYHWRFKPPLQEPASTSTSADSQRGSLTFLTSMKSRLSPTRTSIPSASLEWDTSQSTWSGEKHRASSQHWTSRVPCWLGHSERVNLSYRRKRRSSGLWRRAIQSTVRTMKTVLIWEMATTFKTDR